jgi:prevent-host-death family protein
LVWSDKLGRFVGVLGLETWAGYDTQEPRGLNAEVMMQVNVQEAKGSLSRLLAEVEKGGDVVIARAGIPVARLVGVAHPAPRRLGFMPGEVSNEAFRPLDDEELQHWGLA